MVFAKTKALLHEAAIRTVDAPWRAIDKISQSLTRDECVNYVRHCGYVQSGWKRSMHRGRRAEPPLDNRNGDAMPCEFPDDRVSGG